MTHDAPAPLQRCLTVWLVVTGSVVITWTTAAEAAASLGSTRTWHGPFEDLLVAVASAVLLACAARLWLITTATVADLARGAAPCAPSGVTRRLVLAACGAVVLAGLGAPALADTESPSDPTLTGLKLPDRAVAPTAVRWVTPVATPRNVVGRSTPAVANQRAGVIVQPGDSLWSIAADRLPPSADDAEIDAAWRALYDANRSVIGPEPDLIHPGLTITPDSTREARP